MRKRQVFDPNSHLDAPIVERGVLEACKALAVAGLPWQPARHSQSNSLIWLYQDWEWHVIYVRITADDDDWAGVGELPQVLVQFARSYALSCAQSFASISRPTAPFA